MRIVKNSKWANIPGMKRGWELGKSRGNRSVPYVNEPCQRCGCERWVQVYKGVPRSQKLCRKCFEDPYRVKEGGFSNGYGYIEKQISPDSPYISMAIRIRNCFYVREHRLVMAEHLGRPLAKNEVIHHRNGIRDDNRLENLQIVVVGQHSGEVSCPYCHNKFGIR